MKLSILSLVISTLLLVSCGETRHQVEVKNVQSEDQSENWEVSLSYSHFSSDNEAVNQSCKKLNDKIEVLVTDLQDFLKQDADSLFTSFSPEEERPQWKYSLFLSDSVFMATDQFISLRLTAYTFTGGAHGATSYYTLNYDVKNQRLLEPTEILNHDKFQLINELLKSNFENPEECFTTDPTLDQVEVINFSQSNVSFTYGQYTLGAYVCGSPVVAIPIEKLGDSFLLRIQ